MTPKLLLLRTSLGVINDVFAEVAPRRVPREVLCGFWELLGVFFRGFWSIFGGLGHSSQVSLEPFFNVKLVLNVFDWCGSAAGLLWDSCGIAVGLL